MSYMYRSTRAPRRGRSSSNSRSGGRRTHTKATIHPSKFIKPAVERQEDVFTPQFTFSELPLHELLQANLAEHALTTPTPIQEQAIPIGLLGNDIVGIANTGTGKTLAFVLPLVQRMITDKKINALVIAPTRELAQQIEADFRRIAKGSGLTGALLIGGSSMGTQLRDLRANPRLVVGTPGRIKDHIERRTFKIHTVNAVVLDEVDRMLDMGFINDIRSILGGTATTKQSFFFSATMEPRVSALIETFGSNPVAVSVKRGETSDNVEQDIVSFAASGDKISKLHDILITEGVDKVLVFDETKRSVERLSNELVARGFKADAIHGGKTQGQRQRALDKFKRSEVNILVATDVAARGLDIKDITHVINYATPQSYEDYVHRIGRAGRAGRKGFALTFVSER